jgi:hypothetical protein
VERKPQQRLKGYHFFNFCQAQLLCQPLDFLLEKLFNIVSFSDGERHATELSKDNRDGFHHPRHRV